MQRAVARPGILREPRDLLFDKEVTFLAADAYATHSRKATDRDTRPCLRMIAYKLYFLCARCTVLTYQTPAGNAPVDEYIAGLEGMAATKAAALVKLLEALGHELRLPHSRSLGEGLYELRDVGTGVRLFYVLLPDNRAALLDGITKKRDDIPDVTIKRLRTLQSAVNYEFKKPKKKRR